MTIDTEFGVNVWWTIPETSVDGAMVQGVLQKHGFEANDMKVPTRQSEISRAAYSFQDRRSKENRRVTEKAKDTGKNVIYGILDREQSGDVVAFNQHTTVRFTKGSGEVSVSGSLKDAYLKALSEFEGKITDADIRCFLRKIIRMSYGVAKRPTGGIYFVPAKFAFIIEKAQAVLAELNTGARIYKEEIVNNVEARQNVWDSVEADVEARLSSAVATVGRIERRVSALQGQRENIEEANELMQVYRSLLGEEARYEEITEKIEEAVRMVSEKMTALQPVPVPPVPEGPRVPKGKTGGMTVVDVALKVLAQSGKPMSCHEMVDAAVALGIYVSNCASPYNSFNTTLLRALKLGEKRLRKIGRGVYEMAA